ncbi:DUF7680 family protein [Halobellus ordinarius]|uniref:DUF7680 family protein n=1 Tax=Halobellus ordinarius TaxID=3075120 RepID=UPI002880550D|nr:hypothetical protein [Halobellus sp. ZY16]
MSIQHNQEQIDSFALGSSVYGGRPTFALVRDEDGKDVTLTLYELLPTEQANARRRRLERRRQQASKTMPFGEIIDENVDGVDDWTWDNWVAVKVRQLSGSRLRSILQLVDESLRGSEHNHTKITSTGDSAVLLYEGAGIRLSLGFIGIKPLRRVDRMRALSRGISKMSLEECYYWYAKCRSPNCPGGEKALRTLLTGNRT